MPNKTPIIGVVISVIGIGLMGISSTWISLLGIFLMCLGIAIVLKVRHKYQDPNG